ncbi:MAG TPA: hypothetical protein VF763_00330 [Candidatus Limnocylindrales bacterium]
MPDPLETVLRLVSEGRLRPDEAAAVLDALAGARRAADEAGRAAGRARDAADRVAERARDRWRTSGSGRQMHIRVSEGDREVLDLRVPFTVASLASDVLPGLSEAYRSRLRQALESGARGPILDVRDEHGGVRIAVE